MRPLRSNDIRQQNEKLVLHLIRSRPNISQSEIVAATGLRPPTVYRIFSLLEQRGLIRVVEDRTVFGERKGRRPLPFAVVEDASFTIGVDFWAGSATVALFDFSGRTISRKACAFLPGTSADEVLGELVRLIRAILRASQVEIGKLLGIGIGAPGVVDVENGIVVVYDRIAGMNNFDLKAYMGERFNVPIAVHNNCSVIALAAHRYGEARKYDSLAVLLIRSGMGGAFVRGGQLYVSQFRTAFEIGNFVVAAAECERLIEQEEIVPYRFDERKPNCRERTIRTKLEDFICEDTIFRTVSSAAGVQSWEELDERLNRSDRRVLESLEPLGLLLSNAARNTAFLLNPEAVMIVSRYRSISAYFREALLHNICEGEDSARVHLADVLAEEYDATRACQGAADLILDDYFSITH